MFFYIKGIVTNISHQKIILEISSIGIEINVPVELLFSPFEETKVFLYIYTYEDKKVLYGFKTEEEKCFFTKLLTVPGIGPKSALNILSKGSVDEINSWINQSNIKAISSIPGIGKKTAQQIIISLRKENLEQVSAPSNIELKIKNVLSSLGYSNVKVSNLLPILDYSLSENEIIKQAIVLLSNNK